MAHEWCTEAVSEAVSNTKQGITYHLILINYLNTSHDYYHHH